MFLFVWQNDTMYQMIAEQGCYYVRPTTQRYGVFWDEVPGGVELIPIRNTVPTPTPSLRWAYRLNAAALLPWQVIRLTNWYARRFRVSQEQARWEVLTDFPVYADEVELVAEKEQDAVMAPALSFLYTISHSNYRQRALLPLAM